MSKEQTAAIETLYDVIEHFGGVEPLADALGVTRPAIYRWLNVRVPPMRALQIEALSDGKFPAVKVCPDLARAQAGESVR